MPELAVYARRSRSLSGQIVTLEVAYMCERGFRLLDWRALREPKSYLNWCKIFVEDRDRVIEGGKEEKEK